MLIIVFTGVSSVFGEPVLRDRAFEVETFVTGLNWPTTMEFVNEDILVLEKNSGEVRLVRNGVLEDEPILKVNVVSLGESGLLGIVAKDTTVYLYISEKNLETGEAFGNRIYKYNWDGVSLTDPILIKELPIGEGKTHNAGVMTVDLNGTVYAVIGDTTQNKYQGKTGGIFQNNPTGEHYEAGVIFPILEQGTYYAMGIRNSFGLTIDPVTGYLWDTENGRQDFDEINLVMPKFNSGWEIVMGPATSEQKSSIPAFEDYIYSDPEFTFEIPIGVTAISFVQSDFFNEYENSVFVGDFLNGNLYEFKLNDDRTGFVFKEPSLMDLVLNIDDSNREIIFGTNFGGITDIKVGPDGLIYIVSLRDGAIYRIIPSKQILEDSIQPPCDVRYTLDLSNCNLSGINLQGKVLAFANLTNADLSGANLQGTDLSTSILNGADLTNANLTNANLKNVEAYNARLSGADLSGVDARQSIFMDSNLESVRLTNADLRHASFEKSNLKHADLLGVKMRATIFREADLESANLTDTWFKYNNFENANLKHADLSRAFSRASTFAGANLEGVKITNATMMLDNFQNANLEGANLALTKLNRADLTNANLRKANLSETELNLPNLKNTDFTDTIFYKTKIENCFGNSFMYKILRGALWRIHSLDSPFLEPLEWLIPRFCGPHYYIDPSNSN